MSVDTLLNPGVKEQDSVRDKLARQNSSEWSKFQGQLSEEGISGAGEMFIKLLDKNPRYAREFFEPLSEETKITLSRHKKYWHYVRNMQFSGV